MTYTDFHEEKKVRIDKVPAKYTRRHNELLGMIGIIKEVTTNADGDVLIGIAIKGMTNLASSKNLFWFMRNEITIINDKGEDVTMTLASYNKNYKFCYTTKPGNNSGALELHAYQGELHDGNYVICNNDYGNGALSVRIVVKSLVPREELETNNIDGEVMGVADIDAYVLRKEREKKAVELKKKMMERAKAYQEEAFWRMMAKEDPQMAEIAMELGVPSCKMFPCKNCAADYGCIWHEQAQRLYAKGYRKVSEIFEEIENNTFAYGVNFVISKETFAELKKKYTEGEEGK